MPIVVSSVHVDMDTAGAVDLSFCPPHLSDTLLEFGKFRIS